MGSYDMILDDVNVMSRKYDLPHWMIEEKLYNCEGFTATYYKSMFSKVARKLRRFWCF